MYKKALFVCFLKLYIYYGSVLFEMEHKISGLDTNFVEKSAFSHFVVFGRQIVYLTGFFLYEIQFASHLHDVVF